MMDFVAKTFLGLEEVLLQELVSIGAQDIKKERRAVTFSGDLALMYKANLHLRTASRVLKIVSVFDAADADEIYEQTKKIDWEKYISVNQTFLIDATVYSETFRHSQFVSYRVKDAIADYFTEKQNRRPSVRLTSPDVIINVHISHNCCTISLDSSGESLHKRGYRVTQTSAPINEALAAGILLMSGWNGQMNFIDPMCGSATFLIEAGLIALNIPPGIFRKHFSFENWLDFDKDLFDEIYNDDSGERNFNFKIFGSDISPRALQAAQDNVKAAGLSKYIVLEKKSVAEFEPTAVPALIITNPPYGERLKSEDLLQTYEQLGTTLKHKCMGINTWVISSNIDCLQKIGLKPAVKIKLMNGDLDCELWKFSIFAGKRNDYVAMRGGREKEVAENDKKRAFGERKDFDRKPRSFGGRPKPFDKKPRNFENNNRKY